MFLFCSFDYQHFNVLIFDTYGSNRISFLSQIWEVANHPFKMLRHFFLLSFSLSMFGVKGKTFLVKTKDSENKTGETIVQP